MQIKKAGGNLYRMVSDSLANLVSNLGTSRDKAASTFHVLNLMDDAQLLTMYRSSWMARKIVNIPALDAIRKWRDWQADKGQIEAIEAEEKRLDIKGKYKQALVSARLFGGSAIYIGTNDQDLMQPLLPERIGREGIKFLTVLHKRSLQAGEIERDAANPLFGKPKHYTLNVTDVSMLIHPSRLVIFVGEEIPDNIFGVGGLQDGWGDSVLLASTSEVKNAEGTAANIASLIYEAKVDVIRIPDFMANLSDPTYEQRILTRHRLATTGKGINGTLMLDKEEEYEQKTANFTTLPDILMSFLQIVCGAADIPATRFLGMTPGGLAATGESDLRNYYDRVSSIQQLDIDPATFNLTECLIRSALGSRPAEIHYLWASLWQVSDKERAEIGKLDMETVKGMAETNLFPPEAMANAAVTLFMEHGIFPSLQEQVDDAGGLPDYEAELEAEREAQAANAQVSTTDAAPKTLYVSRKVVNAKAIAAHYVKQGVKTLDPAKMHVTIIYSKTPVDWFKTGESWQGTITLPEGGARDHALFGPPGLEDSFVLMIKSQELEWRNACFIAAGCKSSYEEYQPHITIRYDVGADFDFSQIEPWQGKIELGPEIYEEVKEKVDAEGDE